jgi:hypothetical protein
LKERSEKPLHSGTRAGFGSRFHDQTFFGSFFKKEQLA